jgi:CheY-like chemotaxis protein
LQALAVFQVEPTDVIVSDIVMPGLDGYRFLRVLRDMELPDGSRVPCVAVAGAWYGDEGKRSLESGFDAYVGRPVEPEHLIATIVWLLAARSPYRQERAG